MGIRKYFPAGFVLLGLLLWHSLAPAYDLQQIQQEVQRQGARWIGGETSMTALPPAERQKRLGLIPPNYTGTEPPVTLTPPTTQLPAGFDWRSNGGNYVTGVRDQGSCGSCWAFATTAALESVTLIANRTPGASLNLSEQVLISCGALGSCEGGPIGGASTFFQNTGIPAESCYPYTATNGSCSSACPSWQASTYKISSWKYVTTTYPTLAAIRNALYTYGPLVTTMAVYDDFFSYRSGIYSYVSGGFAGYHAVLIVGYDDINQYFTVKNSWGTWWGESGYFRIAYSELYSPVGMGEWTIAYVGAAPACSFSVGPPTPSSFPASGGNAGATVTTQSSCPWSAASDSSWITVASGATGTGNGTVTVHVQANTGGYRTGTVTIAGQKFTLEQDSGIPPCSYSLNPISADFEAGGGSGGLAVYAGAGCAWTAASSAGWITITAVSAAAGNGTVVYSVAANPTIYSRSGTVNIAGQSFTVTQAGMPCSYSISPGSSNFDSPGGSGAVNVTSLAGCPWTAASNVSWITVTSGAAGSGSGTVGYSVAANAAIGGREGTLTIAGNTFRVGQNGVTCSYSVSSTSLNAGTSGAVYTVAVSSPPACGWSAVSSVPWVKISSGASGTGSGSVDLVVEPNTGGARAGTATIAGQTVSITQQGSSPHRIVLAMNCGGGQYVDPSGITYLADQYYTGGWSAGTSTAIAGTADGPLYQTERYGNYSYAIPLLNGDYQVSLKFAEFYWSAPGKRVFDVWMQGTKVLTSLDIFALVGKNRAYDVSLPATVTDGKLRIAVNALADYGKISAIVVTQVQPAEGVILAMNCGGGQYVDASGITYQADQYYSGGWPAATSAAIAGTEDGPLYQTERYGNYSYAIPLANGDYQVSLKFTEFYWSSPGSRIFDVWMQGARVLSSLDLFALTGKNRAYDVSLPVTVADGKLRIALNAIVDYGKLSAIVVRSR